MNLQLSAPIPPGGQLNILLPSGITPVIPIQCANISGFTLTNNQTPTCIYNSTANIISTVNFNYPYLASTSSAVISIQIINPPDTSNYPLYF